MRVNCEGCAGCCVDWRPLADAPDDHERVGPERPLDDVYNLVPLDRDEVRAFVDAGLGDVLTPRLWERDGGRDDDAGGGSAGDAGGDGRGRSVTVDGFELAAIDGRPVFFVGLRKIPKPVAPVGTDDPSWLPTCAFLDPETLQCRIHGDDRYPDECATYPGRNLLLDVETVCERVEAEFGDPGERLVDDAVPEDAEPLFGPQALGGKVFAHPDPDALADVVERIGAGEPTDADRAEFVGTAAGASPGTLHRNDDAYREYRERALDADSWAGRAIADWRERAGETDPDPALGREVEGDRGAPSTPGWD